MGLLELIIVLAIFAVIVAAVVWVLVHYAGLPPKVGQFVIAIGVLIGLLYVVRALMGHAVL